MSHFERTEGAEDNLGNNPHFVSLEDLAIATSPNPEEILMNKEDEEENGENLLESSIDIDDADDEPSNWESDVEEGKYDELQKVQPINENIRTNPVVLKERQNIVGIEEMKGWGQKQKYWDVPSQKVDNSKPKRPQDSRDSVRFDEAV